MSREGSPVAPAFEAAQPAVEKKEDTPIAPAAQDIKEAIAAESKAAVESAPAEEASDNKAEEGNVFHNTCQAGHLHPRHYI